MEHGHICATHALDERDRLLGEVGHVALLDSGPAQAVVARLVALALVKVVLAKVREDLLPPAVGRVHAVLDHALDVGLVRLFLLARPFAFVDQSVDQLRVRVRVEQHADRRLAVAARTTRFL